MAPHILDVCRDNPFMAPAGKKLLGGAGGLAADTSPEGAFSMPAAGACQQALDWLNEGDPDPNSVTPVACCRCCEHRA